MPSTTVDSGGGFGSGTTLETTSFVRLPVQFLYGDTATALLAVWPYVVPVAAMGYALVLGRDSGMRFYSRLSTTLPTRSTSGRIMETLSLSSGFAARASVYVGGPSPPGASYFLRYVGRKGVSLPDKTHFDEGGPRSQFWHSRSRRQFSCHVFTETRSYFGVGRVRFGWASTHPFDRMRRVEAW